MLIETILAAFEMDEILYELREHSAGLNAGRWDYIFSIIKKFRDRPEFVLPDRAQVTMTVPFMRAYTELLVQTCHRRGAHAMGGMAAFIPSRRDAEVNERALAKVREDKEREAGDGFDGTWVAHPDLVPVATDEFDRVLGDRGRTRSSGCARTSTLRRPISSTCASPDGDVTEEGVREQRQRRPPLPRVVAARRRRRRDRQPDGGRGDGGDLALPDLAVDPPRPASSASTSSRSRTRCSPSAGEGRWDDARAVFDGVALGDELRRVPDLARLRSTGGSMTSSTRR